MEMNWLQLSIPIAVLLVASAQAEVDCTRRIDFNTMKDCCKMPIPNWAELKPECGSFLNSNMKHHSPCGIECIFNSSKILQNGEINMANVRQLASQTYNTEFAPVFIKGFENCIPTVKQFLTELKKGGRQMRVRPGEPKCSPEALMYSICVHRYVYLNCPTTAWTPSTACENAKEFGNNCEDKVGGIGNRKGRPRGRRPNGFYYQRQRHVDNFEGEDKLSWGSIFGDI